MNEKVREFMMQWFEDFCYATEAEPKRYEVHTETLPTDYGFRQVTTIVDTALNMSTETTFKPTDHYDYRLGVAIAWARQLNIPIPAFLRSTPKMKSIHKMQPGMKFIYEDEECTVLTRTNDKARTILTVKFSTYYDVLVIDEKDKQKVEVLD